MSAHCPLGCDLVADTGPCAHGVELNTIVNPSAGPRRFVLQRDHDASGVSGVGVVAEGIQFSDGTVALRWVAGEHRSTVIWPDLVSVEVVHGHGGLTNVVWLESDSQTALAQAWRAGHAAGRDYQGDGWNCDMHDPERDNPFVERTDRG